MTEGGGDQYRDQYRDGSFPPAPPPPWADQGGGQAAAGEQTGEPSGQQPVYGQQQTSGQQPAYGQQGPPSGQQPAYGQQQTSGQQQPPWEQPTAYGQQPAYGQMPSYSDQQPPHGQNPYGQSPWGTPPGYGRPDVTPASWGRRAGALILDGLFGILLSIPAAIAFGVTFGTADTITSADGTTEIQNVNGGLLTLAIVLAVAAFVVGLWNQGWRQGARGWSWGKQAVGIKLVREIDAQPPGGWTGIGRLLLRNVLGIVPFYTLIDYLWPLWDEKNQTLDDKMLSTLVIKV